MPESIISEGKTTQEAIENGLKLLNCSRDRVEINILENTEKRSFFSILTPRIVKVEIKLKEKKNIEEKIENKISKNIENIEERKQKVEKFLKDFLFKISTNINYKVEIKNNIIKVEIDGESIGYLIGYRGETLNSLQILLTSIANKNYNTRAKVILDIQGYREKRKNVLEDLAIKISKTVLKTGKSITLEPMSAYERKIIHNKLQENDKITTHSIGEEPHRRVVISKK